MSDTPIFDELRDLYEQAPGRFRAPAAPGADPSAETAGKPPTMIVVTGGRRVGKTTFVASVSDTPPRNVGAAADFGRVILPPNQELYLLGTSQLPRSGFSGALGAVVLVDTRRLEDAFATISYLEDDSGLPFVVAINMFDGELAYQLDEVREALTLAPDVLLVACDARDQESAVEVLQELVSLARAAAPEGQRSPPGELPP